MIYANGSNLKTVNFGKFSDVGKKDKVRCGYKKRFGNVCVCVWGGGGGGGANVNTMA